MHTILAMLATLVLLAAAKKWLGNLPTRLDLFMFMAIISIYSYVVIRLSAEKEKLYSEHCLALEEAAKERKKSAAVVAELEDANRELESFGYTVSHDLRKPLTVIYTAAQAIEDNLPIRDNGRLVNYLTKSICDACEWMGDLIESLHKISQLSSSELSFEQVNLSSIADKICSDLNQADPDRVVEWEIAQGISAYGDRVLLRVMMENLLDNAWKYTSKEAVSKIWFGVKDTVYGLTFFVRDNGIGFDSDVGEELFKPFVRLVSAEKFCGTGIGLATVKKIIKRHDGNIWAESGPGAGATFYFNLPERKI